jgi:eukaryotic-like serine/threonine-protein kinase
MNDLDPAAEAIFHAAIQIKDPIELKEYLARVCDGNAPLAEKIARLLAASRETEGFFAARAEVFRINQHSPTAAMPVMEGAGTRIGRYKLLQAIGEGGMGIVYMAEQEEPVRRRVALKIIKAGMDTREVVARFEAERQALALMDHPNIARVLDGGTTETGRPYFVMELVQGVPITEFCDRNRLPAKERLKLFLAVCHAIQSAHQKGIIHRDIKPSNVLVTLHHGEPMAKVIDFGIAKALHQKLTEKTLFTRFATMIGTPAYMSPEQAEMSSMDIDTRTDVYGLGVLLYELLTGSTPFSEQRLRSLGYGEIQRIIMQEEPDRPSTRLSTLTREQKITMARSHSEEFAALNKRLKGDLDWIVMKCLEKDRTRRYDAANDLALDLKRHLSNEPVSARPPSTAYRLQQSWRRNKLVYLAGAAVLVAMAAGLTVAAFGWRHSAKQRDAAVLARAGEELQRKQAQANEKLAVQERGQAELAREEIRRRAYAAEINTGFQALKENNLGRALELLRRQEPKAGEEDLRGFEWRHLWKLCQSDEKAAFHDTDENALAISPNGQWLVSGGKQIAVRAWPSLAPVTTIDLPATTLTFSPDSKQLVSAHASVVTIWNTTGWEKSLTLLEAHAPAVFSPDGRWLVTRATGGYDLRETDTWTKKEFLKGVPTWDFQAFKGVAFSKDGRLLVIAGHPGGRDVAQFQVLDFPSLEVRTNFVSYPHKLGSAALSPNGKWLLIGDWTGNLTIWDVATGRVARTIREHSGAITQIDYSRDARTFATSSADRTVLLWDADKHEVLLRLRGHLDEVWSVTISPDGRQLVSRSISGNTKVWDAAIRHEQRMLPDSALITGFSDDSAKLVVQGNAGQRIWNLADNTVTAIPLEPFTFRGMSTWGDVRGLVPHAVFGQPDGSLEIWNLATNARIESRKINDTGVSTAALSPDGRFIAASDAAGQLKVWEFATHREPIRSLSAGGKLMVVAFSPDGKLLAALTEGENPHANVWSVPEGRLLFELAEGRTTPALAISPDGRLLATAHLDNHVRLWEIPSGKSKAILKGHVQAVMAVAFSSDGKTLSTGGDDGKVKLWNVVTEQEMATFGIPKGGCRSIRFSPDGRSLAVGSFLESEAYIWLWEAPSMKEIAAAGFH